MSAPKVLIVDDEIAMLENLSELLSSEGYRCWTLSDPLKFPQELQEVRPDVLISDLRMPGADGMTILSDARSLDPTLPVILITAYATFSSAAEATQEGAFDYLAKPFTADQLYVAVRRALKYRKLVLENEDLWGRVRGAEGPEIVGSSPPMLRLIDRLERIATTAANVLITGESGTGKELVARSIHARSARKDGPFTPVDCAALPENLLESELFGHEKGAFTGAVRQKAGLLVEARGGTVFLDEIAELSGPLQAKLLRALDQRQVRPVGGAELIDIDIRLLAATNADLSEAVEAGDFREDLYYRLNVVHVSVPPLRARPGDIALLVSHFLEVLSPEGAPTVSSEAWELIESHEWPGNVRQLRNMVERAIALQPDGVITPSDLPPEIRFSKRGREVPKTSVESHLELPYAEAREKVLADFRAAYVRNLLDACGGNVSRAARAVGVNRRTVHRWLAEIVEGGSGTGG
jgi:DNA-binding NtrC family response regulator